ncbi:thioredoxin-like domain-containing protein [Cerasicoccus frondis]|uniref:thioredoxin-like domain-containing protein n=1 Tax=Cerasicoccus frondis TaxID=490090 RepID=UPI002852A792|nr:thioredoxin-like domain-containing protein [Cerasicoccus frondis]
MKLFATLSATLLFALIADARDWTSQDGRTMTADFVETYERDGVMMVVFSKGDGMRYQVPLSRLSQEDQDHVQELVANGSQNNPSPREKAVREKTSFETAISRNLVELNGSRLERVGAKEFTPKDYYAIYYSAHWCPPCRKFTPKLVQFYNDAAAQQDKFEVIFVSSDNDEDAMEEYMSEYEMPWLALDYDRKKSSRELTQFSGSGIPCLVLVDRDGNVLKDSYVNGDYAGPSSVLRELERLLSTKEG